MTKTEAPSVLAVRLKAIAVSFVLLGLVACSGGGETASSGGDPFRVALIANGPLTDSGFNQAHKESLDEAKRLLGDRIEVQSIGDVPETGDAERILRRLIAERSNLIIAASFGYQDTSVKLATEFPQVRFLQAWGFKPAANLGTYSAKMYEAWYVMGVVAGKMSKTGKLGIVAAHPIPPMKWQINAYVLGARSVNPKVTASVAFINHWFDPGLATEAAETLINQGADVVTGVLDNSVAVARTAERRKVMLIGHNTDLSSFAPNSILVGTKWQWGKLYADAIGKMLDGKWNGTSGDLNGGFKEGYVGITNFSARVPADVRQAAEAAVARIVSGELVVYRGPIKDNTGRTVVADGAVLSHDQIMGIDWFVEGVR
jgi:basic membrane protein A